MPRIPPSRANAAARAAANDLPPAPPKPVLYDMPVSNNGARVRYVIYSQGLDVSIEPPTNLGGLKSPAFLALNPQGKMPLLRLPASDLPTPAAMTGGASAAIYESEVISQYLLDRYCAPGTLQAADAVGRARQRLATRVHDLYVTTVQSCMYRSMTPQERSAGLKQLSAQLDALEDIVAAGGGPFIAGDRVTTADAAIAPTVEFMVFILPRVFGWRDVFAGRPALKRWWASLRSSDPAMARVLDEVKGGLEGWEAKDRWGELGIKEQIAKAEEQYAF